MFSVIHAIFMFESFYLGNQFFCVNVFYLQPSLLFHHFADVSNMFLLDHFPGVRKMVLLERVDDHKNLPILFGRIRVILILIR